MLIKLSLQKIHEKKNRIEYSERAAQQRYEQSRARARKNFIYLNFVLIFFWAWIRFMWRLCPRAQRKSVKSHAEACGIRCVLGAKRRTSRSQYTKRKLKLICAHTGDSPAQRERDSEMLRLWISEQTHAIFIRFNFRVFEALQSTGKLATRFPHFRVWKMSESDELREKSEMLNNWNWCSACLANKCFFSLPLSDIMKAVAQCTRHDAGRIWISLSQRMLGGKWWHFSFRPHAHRMKNHKCSNGWLNQFALNRR